MYEIYATQHFLQALGKLDGKDQSRIREKIIEILPKNAYFGRPLHGVLKGKYRLRVGDYRVIYEIEEAKKRIYLIGVGRRGIVYK